MAKSSTNNGTELYDSPLYQLLLQKLPETFTYTLGGQRRLHMTSLAKECGYTKEALYRVFRSDKISGQTARKLVDLSSGKLTKEDLFTFLNF